LDILGFKGILYRYTICTQFGLTIQAHDGLEE
jgi:hypothetical protein